MKTGVLCIHGFTGGPFELQPLVDFFQANTDWKIVVPTLPGHEVTAPLQIMSAEDWMMAAEQKLRLLQKEVDRVFVVGFSMGGIIAMYLALRYKIEKLVLLSAAAKYIYPKQLLQDARGIAKDAKKEKMEDNHLFRFYRKKLRETPLLAAMEFMRLVRIVKPYYAQIKIPVLIGQGKLDGIVPFKTASFLYDQISSTRKELFFSETGKHHICYSEDRNALFHKTLLFMQEKEGVEMLESN